MDLSEGYCLSLSAEPSTNVALPNRRFDPDVRLIFVNRCCLHLRPCYIPIALLLAQQAVRLAPKLFASAPSLRRYRPTIASTSALRKRSTTSMKPIDGMSSSSAVIDAI